MIDNLPTTDSVASPFDGLRQVRNDGSEFWSGRDLMPYYGYSNWQKFSVVIERGVAAAENAGADVTANFILTSKVSGKRGPKQEDVELSRYGAYLVAMNGDPRKPTVAAMQTYFAIRTRHAEVSLPALTEDEIVHQALAITARRVEELKAEVAILKPEAIFARTLLDARGDMKVGDAAKALCRAGVDTGQNRLFKAMGGKGIGWVYRDRSDGCWRARQEAIDAGYLGELPQSREVQGTEDRVVAAPQVRVTPRGLQRLGELFGVTEEGRQHLRAQR